MLLSTKILVQLSIPDDRGSFLFVWQCATRAGGGS